MPLFAGHLPVQEKDFDDAPQIANQLDPETKETLQYLKRGDLGIPNHALRCAAYQYAGQCVDVNREYMLCKQEEGDPRKCLKYGDRVSECAANFFRNVSEACTDQFVKMAQCVEKTNSRKLIYCRAEQLALDTCMFEKLGYDKLPDAGVYSDIEVKTDRPKPKNPYNFRPIIDSRRLPAEDYFERPIGQTRDGDEKK
ncbi:NADH dehydrogenase [ubiquinone] 1 alpha subcomplex subunit 8-like [Styela clava]